MVEALQKTLTAMVLEMYLDNKLVDSLSLSLHKINDAQERELYIKGAINHLLEKWDDKLQDQNLKPEFFIRTTAFNYTPGFLRL